MASMWFRRKVPRSALAKSPAFAFPCTAATVTSPVSASLGTTNSAASPIMAAVAPRAGRCSEIVLSPDWKYNSKPTVMKTETNVSPEIPTK